jgi:arsenate reductase
MNDDEINVLILCTGNSARSIMGEAIFRRMGKGRVKAHSAGSAPLGRVNPFALRVLGQKGHDISAFRSKSWDEFAIKGAPALDYVITVCDKAAGESCPLWPGEPVKAHWGMADPAAAGGSDDEKLAAFEFAHDLLQKRIGAFLALDLASLEAEEAARELAAIAAIGGH